MPVLDAAMLPRNGVGDDGGGAAVEMRGGASVRRDQQQQQRDSVVSTDSVLARMSLAGGPLRKEIRKLLREDGIRLWEPPHLLDVSSCRTACLLCVFRRKLKFHSDCKQSRIARHMCVCVCVCVRGSISVLAPACVPLVDATVS
jgi:hypothetical protein